MAHEDAAEIGRLLALIVHDLRNPAASVAANMSFVEDAIDDGDPDLREALEDVQLALGDLMRGLEHVAWIGRWLSDDPPVQVADGDVVAALRTAAKKNTTLASALDLPEEALEAKGGATVPRLVEVLLANARQHARKGPARVTARREDGHVVVDVTDPGAALAEELRPKAFTLAGQKDLKGRVDGRYGRVAGLLAARVLAEALGAELEAGGEDGAAVFRVRLPATG